jgi:hypothetical protein
MAKSESSCVRANRRRSLVAASVSALALTSSFGTALSNDILFDGIGGQLVNGSPVFMDTANFLEQKVEVDVDTQALNNPVLWAVGVRANGEIDVDASQNVEAASNAIWVINTLDFGAKNDIAVTSSAATTSTLLTGIIVDDARGNVTIDGAGTGTVKGLVNGIYADTWVDPDGTVTIKDFASVEGTTGNGIWVPVLDDANIDISNVGPVTAGLEGIWTAAVNGNTSIDATSGKVTAGGDGIAHSWGAYTAGNTGTGSVDIVTGDVDAGLVGVFSYTLSGDNSVDTTAGTIDAGTDGVDAWVFVGNGAVDVKTADVNAGREGVWTRAWDGDTSVDTTAGKVTSTLGDGVIHASLGYAVGSNLGKVDIKTGDVEAALVGVFAYTNTGNNSIDTTAGSVDAGTNGVAGWVFLGAGNADIKTADVDAAGIGVWSRTWDGDATVDTTAGTVNSGLDGVIHASLGYAAGSNLGDASITTADVNAGAVGVFSYTLSGNNEIDTTAGTIDAGTDGVAGWVFAGAGTVDIKTADVDATRIGVWSRADDGDTTVDTTAGTINAGLDGIVHATIGYTAGSDTGNITITSADVFATQYGIFSYGFAGNNTVNVTDGSIVSSDYRGVQAATWAGNTTLNVGVGATVEALEFGVVTGTTTGVATTNNLGTIQDKADDGLNATLSGDAYWNYLGNGVLNNEAGGVINGRVHDDFSTTFTMNNKIGSIWNAGTDFGALTNFGIGATTDTVNNAGLINIRSGFTSFTHLDNLNNQAGGVIDMQYGTNTMDDLTSIVSMDSASGSTLKFDVDYAIAPTWTNNHTSYGGGDADTIYVINATASSAVTVDLNNINRGTQNSLIATSGSIALIDAGIGLTTLGMADPGLGGLPTLVASSNYVFAGGDDPTTAAVKFVLQEGLNGGVYLRWAPNITAHSMGGFAGGDMDDPSTGAARMSGAAGVLGGAGGGLGASGGPSGGGAAGQVGDIAAQNSYGQSGASGAAFCGDGSRTTAWIAADGADTKFSNNAKGWNAGSAFGIDYDVTPDACGQVAIGAFGSFGTSASSFETGSSDTDSKGAGAYVRFAPGNGLYATALVAANWGESELTNNIFGSTANQDSFGMLVNGSVGYSSALGDSASFDIRAFASRAWIDGDGFTDSAGIVVDGSEADMTAIGALATLSYDFTQSTSAFLSGGLRHVTMDHSVTAFGIEVSGKAEANYASVEAGLRHALSDNAALSISGNGDFSKDSESWGGRIGLAFKF